MSKLITMASNLLVCSKLESIKNKSFIKVNIDLDKTVSNLRELIAKQLNIDENKFDLMCFGRILSGDKTISSYNIKNGTIIFVLHKVSHDSAESDSLFESNQTKPSQSDISAMVVALRTALMNPSFRNILDKLNDADVRENLIAVTPGLNKDPITIAILQDPDLLSILTDPSNIQKVLEKHPCLSEAATNLAAAFHEENISGNPSSMLSSNPCAVISLATSPTKSPKTRTISDITAPIISPIAPPTNFNGPFFF